MPRLTRRDFAMLAVGAGAALVGGVGANRLMREMARPDPETVRREYRAGDIVELDGWILSRSEANWLTGE